MKIELTDAFVASARAQDGKRLELFDAHAKADGLMLLVNPTGAKVWVVRYRTMDGRQRRFEIGRYPNTSLAKARLRASEIRNRARRGEDPAGDRRQQTIEARIEPIKTLADLHRIYTAACSAGEWRPRKKVKRASTVAEEQGVWDRHLGETLGDLRVEEVTPAAIRKVLRALKAAGKGTTANRVRSLLRQMFNFAIHEDRVQRSPVEKVGAVHQEKPRERVLSDVELQQFWTAWTIRKPIKHDTPTGKATAYIGEPVSLALRLLLLTLTRRGEVAGLRVSELDLKSAAWTIPGERTKNGKALLVPLPDDALTVIKRAIEIANETRADRGLNSVTEFVFPSPRDPDKPITPAALSHSLRSVRLALALPDARTHDLRRTAASLMVSERLGVSPFIVGRLLNHTTETGGAAQVTLAHYAIHDFAREKRHALNAWSALLDRIVSGRPQTGNVTSLREGAA